MRWLLIGLMAVGAWADTPAQARKSIEEAYRRRDAAYERLDAKGALAVASADYIVISADGEVRKMPEIVKDTIRLAENARSMTARTEFEFFVLNGSTATVGAREHFEIEFRAWMPGRPSRIVVDDFAQDEWVRTGVGWRKKSSTNLKLSESNGKKVLRKKEVGYISVLSEGGKRTAMQTAIWRFVSPTGQTVDLVAAVHLGEKSYYRQLNHEFKAYQGVLYELIAPHLVEDEEGQVTRPIPVPIDAADNPLSAGQLYLTKMLGLHFQLNEVDYSPKNFVHADLSPEELLQSMTRRGESGKTIFAQVMRESLANSAQIDPADALALNYSMTSILVKGPTKSDQMILRRVLASSFKQIEKIAGSLDGPNGSTLLAGRNQAAIAVLKNELKRGRKRLAIFYGAAHMTDLEKRLLKLGFKKQNVRFLKAWNLR